MKAYYLIYKSSGEYSDHYCDNLFLVSSEEEAQNIVDCLNQARKKVDDEFGSEEYLFSSKYYNENPPVKREKYSIYEDFIEAGKEYNQRYQTKWKERLEEIKKNFSDFLDEKYFHLLQNCPEPFLLIFEGSPVRFGYEMLFADMLAEESESE